MSAPVPAVNYKVTGMVPFTQYDPGGQVTEGLRIYFTTSTGLTGQVFAPRQIASNVDALRALIEGEVAQLATIHGLSGTVEVG